MHDYQVRSRFEAKIHKLANGCWDWMAHLDRLGYGKIRVDKRTREAHRVAYELYVGPIPAGLEIDHLCRNRACVNPGHLEAVTRAENNRRSDNWGGVNSRKTHCPQGHIYDAENTYVSPKGRRVCRMCRRTQGRLRRAAGGWRNGQQTPPRPTKPAA